MEHLLPAIISNDSLHARWLNTLSLLENTGARKISASEDTTSVTEIILKHAAEEHRHAYYLKKQIAKVAPGTCPTYAPEFLLAPTWSKYYLNALDVKVCRYLKQVLGLKGAELKFAAYLLVTYAIEVRADLLYPVYQQCLDNAASRVQVKSIILEEEGHLEEMIAQLKSFSPDWQQRADEAVVFETLLFDSWVNRVAGEIGIQQLA
ncbi:hypothetical protein FFF34_006700 [Inquilinus sp. KBS0705]|nr:hypothetical protein FFF34_006700 [Inquilinus sp. KBS0705]